jgi:DNA-binding response OmpR family regulator
MSNRILIAEDNADTADLMRCVLAAANHETRSVGTLGEGLIELKTFKPNVILLDLSVCDLPLSEFAAHCTPNMRTILVSASPQIEEVAQVLHLRFFLRKPFDPDALLRMVNEALVSGEHAAV